MNIEEISNELCAQFVEDYLSSIKSDNISNEPVKVQKIKRNEGCVQVFAKQRQKHLVHNTKLTQKYIATFVNLTNETMVATLQMGIMKGVDPMKLDISKDANQYFEEHLKQIEESSLNINISIF